ncbi:hypothetical protein AAG906_031903 [Vitis piasezkii]
MEVAIQGRKWPITKETSVDIKISLSEKLVVTMSYEEVYRATNGFSQDNVVGTGDTGTTYKAALPDGLLLAIKSMDTERILAYKFMSNGNLFDLLHRMQVKDRVLDWPLRVKIAVGLARGLAWLHCNRNFQVCHHNISSKCILLDQNFDPKISNFGGARLMNSNHKGSNGSSFLNGEAPEHKDVYGFGIVLLELVTGEEPSKVTSQLGVCSFGFYEAIDKSLIGQGYDGEIFQFLRVAGSCIRPIQDGRPTMLDVYKTLRAAGERHSQLTDDSDASTQTVISATNTSYRNKQMGAEITEEIE